MTLAHEIWGEGAIRVVALHGFTGNRNAWSHLKTYWGDACQVLAVDLPGHGETPISAAPTFEAAVDAVVDLVRSKGWDDVNLLGYSLGARVSLGVAVKAPDLFRRAILESGSPGLNRRKARQERRRTDEELAASIETDGVEAFVRRWEELPIFSGLRSLPEETRDSLRARRLTANPDGLAASLRTLGLGAQPNYWPLLPRLHVPVLLVTGERDTKFTETAKKMAAELPMAWRCTLSGSGHAPHLEVAQDYAREVLGFLKTPWIEAPQLEREA